jgi:hypothetical protein
VKAWIRRFILKHMFTPVRALTLERAKLRAGEQLVTVTSYCTGNHWSINLHYNAPTCDAFYYTDLGVFKAERQILEGMVK